MADGDVDVDGEEGQGEDLSGLLGKIADQLADLSRAEDFPVGFRGEVDPFDAADVDFDSNGWLLRLLQVQPWLLPSGEMERKSVEQDSYDAAKSFFSSIDAENAGDCVGEMSGIVRLTSAGAEYLAARLDTATDLQRRFSEWLESLGSKEATDQWTEAWDEVASEVSSAEPIRARSEVWRINDFAGRAIRGHLNLNPSYQRGDVWPTRDAQKLIESILRGIPLPSIILLRPKSRGGIKQAKYEVVDGKQRLTSILRFIGKHPEALSHVAETAKHFPKEKLDTLFATNYKRFRSVWKNATGEALSDKKESERYFPFRLAKTPDAFKGQLSNLAGKYYHEIRDELINVGESQVPVSDVFELSGDYKIPLIEYLEASARQIHEVFHLYNRQGKHLNAEEIRNALYHELDLVRLVLVASGDNKAAKELAPYIPKEERPRLQSIAEALNGYHFGTARYKRTKLLSWMYALLFQPSEQDGGLAIKSTAKQIDTLFDSVQDADGHRLADRSVLRLLVMETERCLEAHSSVDCWDKRFRDDDKGLKWQELQLVASLVGVFLIGVVREVPAKVLEDHRKQLLALTARHPRPEKTQNKTQWAYIGQVALGILHTTGIDEVQLEKRLLDRYGASCLSTLRAAKKIYKARSLNEA